MSDGRDGSGDAGTPVTGGGDAGAALAERVREAAAAGSPLAIAGLGTKGYLGHDALGEPLSTREHAGIVAYEPTELVVTVRSGTPVRELVDALAAEGQMLPFEPPEHGTIGGVVACALSGPRRPYAGAVRDFVLGARVVDGRGRTLAFGGEVMKNVAGYDVSRVQVGAFGTLGLLLEVSMKVLPRPEHELTLHHTLDGDLAPGRPGALHTLVRMAREPIPLTASLVRGAERYLRLGGSEVAVEAAAARLGGERVSGTDAPWTSVRERTHPFFDDRRPLWRLAVPDHAPPLALDGEWLLDWGGAQRWLASEAEPGRVFAAARAAGGHATRFRRLDADGVPEPVDGPLFQPLGGPMRRVQGRLRDSFDPARLFNRGRFHPEFDDASVAGETSSADDGRVPPDTARTARPSHAPTADGA